MRNEINNIIETSIAENKIVDELVNELKEVYKEESAEMEQYFNDFHSQLLDYKKTSEDLVQKVKYAIINKDEDNQKQILIDALKFVFDCRKFFTQESLVFLKMTNSGTQKIYTQEQIFNNDYSNHFSIVDNQINLLYSNLKEEKNIGTMSITLLKKEIWQNILRYATDFEGEKIYTDPNNNPIYKNINPDINAFYLYRSKTGHKPNEGDAYYYYACFKTKINTKINRDDIKKNKSFVQYNKGHLFEMATRYLNRKEIDEDNFFQEGDTPLAGMFDTEQRDSMPGIRGGDIKNIQLKGNNSRIMKLSNLLNILDGTKTNKGNTHNIYHGLVHNIDALCKATTKQEAIEAWNNIIDDFTDNKENVNNINKELRNKLMLKS